MTLKIIGRRLPKGKSIESNEDLKLEYSRLGEAWDGASTSVCSEVKWSPHGLSYGDKIGL